jgi:uncharacterized membrane protein
MTSVEMMLRAITSPSTRRTRSRPFDADQMAIRYPVRIFNFERKRIMKNSYAATIAIALSALASGQVMAADAGDTIEPTTGMTMREINPAYYSGATALPGKTRQQVSDELATAVRNSDAGDTVEPTTGLTMREINPSRFAAKDAAPGKTRAEVRAEVVKAHSTHDAGDTVEPTTGLTMREINPARFAKSAS